MPRRGQAVGRNALLLLAGVAACSCSSATTRRDDAADTVASAPTTALAVDSALAVLAGRPLWPGFSALATPVAIFDGTRTYLFRHPSPPTGYVATEGRSDVATRLGRDPAVTANTSALLGGVSTATVMLDPGVPASTAAALTIHELFHVYQRARHSDWQANEADLFTYPVEDVLALSLRRQETIALSRLFDASNADARGCLARTFLGARVQRFQRLGAAAAAYERGTELNEGLAQYVERRATGRSVTLSALDPPADHVRQRAYEVGAALAGALDLLRPGWQRTMEEAGRTTVPLDSLLRETVGALTPTPGCPAPPAAEYASALTIADLDVRALITERARARAEFLGRPGWRLIIEARGAPLFPAGFDPLNVARLSPTAILHRRYLKLQNAHGTIELIGGTALTEATAGQHPLFAGVSRVTFAGFATSPTLQDSAGVLIVDARGLTARLRLASADTVGETMTVRWR